MANNPYKPKKKKKFKISTKNMGVNIDKNEYYEIILSNSAHPEKQNPKSFQSRILTRLPLPNPWF